MRKFTLLLALCLTLNLWAKNEVYETSVGGVLTLEDLSKIAESGVTKTGDLTYTIVKDLELKGTTGFKFENKTTLKMGADVLVRVYGPTEFAVTDTALICPSGEGVNPKGFHLYLMNDKNNVISHLRCEGIGFNVGNEQGTVFENCTFYKSNGNIAKSSVTFSAASVKNVVRNCYFTETQFSCVSNGANVAAGITVENCLLVNCSTAGRNYPYINLIVSGNNGGTYIRNNKIIGGKVVSSIGGAGGISMANLMGITGENKTFIENNEVSDCRYGIQVQGGQTSRVINNKVINCRYEYNSNNGGSGIAISSSSATLYANVYAEGNIVEGCLWGATIINTARANFGYLTKDNEEIEYNPGRNEFRNNGNLGTSSDKTVSAFDPSKPYDMYNNTAFTVYAQGNIWGGTDQSKEEIEKRIFHKNDNGDLGEVIFMPAGSTSGIALTEAEVFEINVNADHSFTVSGVDENTPVVVYDFNGIALWRGTAAQTVTLNRRGVVVVAVGNIARRIML